MPSKVRITSQTLAVLRAFLSRPRDQLSGAMIAKDASIGAGTLYPILARLEGVGWLTSEWEQIDPREEARPRQRFYKLTAAGANNAVAELNRFSPPSGELAWNS